MNRDALVAKLVRLDREGWIWAEEALPPIGERVEVMHVLSNCKPNDGERDADGEWACREGFVLEGQRFTFDPSHWRRLPAISDQQRRAA